MVILSIFLREVLNSYRWGPNHFLFGLVLVPKFSGPNYLRKNDGISIQCENSKQERKAHPTPHSPVFLPRGRV